MRAAGLTDKGMVREINEDSFSIDEASDIYIVCDGMGGHESGEKASGLAVATLVEILAKYDFQKNVIKINEIETPLALDRLLMLGMQEANRRILAASPSIGNMGTTAVMAVARKNDLHIGHIGDSRLYLVRKEEIKQITEDHSVVQQLVKAGVISQAEALVHPYRNVITRCLGIQPDIQPDVFTLALEKDDVIIMCSDGLSNMVTKEDIRNAVMANIHPDAVCRTMIDMANKNGGVDNITIIVLYNN